MEDPGDRLEHDPGQCATHQQEFSTTTGRNAIIGRLLKAAIGGIVKALGLKDLVAARTGLEPVFQP